MKSLVVYFSHLGENLENNEIVVLTKGNTEKVAEYISKITDADLYKLIEKNDYPFDFNECNKRAKQEYDDMVFPEIISAPINVDQYDTIYLGFPIWYRTYPRIISSFIKKYDLKNKVIKPFCTNDEGTFGLALRELNSELKGSILSEGLSIRGSLIDNKLADIEMWVKK